MVLSELRIYTRDTSFNNLYVSTSLKVLLTRRHTPHGNVFAANQGVPCGFPGSSLLVQPRAFRLAVRRVTADAARRRSSRLLVAVVVLSVAASATAAVATASTATTATAAAAAAAALPTAWTVASPVPRLLAQVAHRTGGTGSRLPVQTTVLDRTSDADSSCYVPS